MRAVRGQGFRTTASVRRAVAALVAATLVGAGALAVPSVAAAADAECVPVAVVAFRGSGEKNVKEDATTLSGSKQTYGTGALVTNGWEGPTLRRLLHSFATTPADATWPSGFSPEKVPVLGIGYNGTTGYPAIKVEDNIGTEIFKKLITSSLEGAKYAETVVDDFEKKQPAGCDTKYIVTGYSQGAMAARALADLNNDVIAAVDFGDPYQKPNAPGIEGDVDGEGIVRSFLTGDGKKIVDRFYESVDHQTTICHDNDPICSYSWLWGIGGLIANIEPHTTYMQVGTEATRKARELATLAAAQWKRGTTPAPAPRKAMDVVFVIDTTGSMGGYIDEARRTARTAAEKVFGAARSGRVGLVEYRDYGDDFIARTVVPLSSDADTFYSGLEGLYPSGGGDWEEAVVSGVFEAVRADWNRDASRSVIVIGDAPGHDPEVGTGYTFSQMTDVLTGAGIVPAPWVPMFRMAAPDAGDRTQEPGAGPTADPSDDTLSVPADEPLPQARSMAAAAVAGGDSIALYGISSDPTLFDQLAPVTTATGGQNLSIGSTDEVGQLVLDAIDDASAAPQAALSSAGLPVTGLPVVFSAQESIVSELPATFEFDFDGDAVFDISGTEPAVEHTYTVPGTYEVSVRITDSRGRTSTASVSVTVLAAEVATVQLPDPEDPATALTGASLSAPTMTAAAPATLTVADTLEPGERVGARIVVAGTSDPWMAPALAAFEVPSSGDLAAATLPAGIEPGTYDVLVFTDRARHAALPLTVQPAASAGGGDTPTPSPTPTVPSPGAGVPPVTGTPAGGDPVPVAVAAPSPPTARALSATGGTSEWLPGVLAGGVLLVALGALVLVRVRRQPSNG